MESNKKFFTVFWLGTLSSNVEQEKKLDEGDTIKHVLYFDDNDTEKCLECLRLTSDEDILLVIIGMACNKIVIDEKLFAEIHNLHQVKSVYVDAQYCNRHPSQLFSKVRYVPSQTVCVRIQADLHASAQVAEPFVFNTFDEHSSMAMNGDFIHFQILIDSFVREHFPSKFLDNYSTFAKSKDEFIRTCKEEYQNNTSKLAQIEEFACTYTPEQALHWYTRSSFLYILLNRALRANDIKLILIFRFFIIDLYNQLAEKSFEPFAEENERDPSPTYYVYRGQLMSKQELDILRKSLGNIISIKSFLSTTLDRQTASFYLGHSSNPSQSSVIQVLIEINLGDDNTCMNDEKPFANITGQSSFDVEKEVLFMAGSYFRVSEVRRDDKDIWYVRLAILRPFNNPLRSKWGALYEHMKISFIHPMLISSHVGAILFQSGKFDQAQVYYEQLVQHLKELVYVPEGTEDEEERRLSSPTKHKSEGILGFLKDLASNKDECEDFQFEKTQHISLCYYALGRITNEKGLFDHSIVYYQAVLNRTSPSYITREQPKNSISHALRALCRLGLGATYELNGTLKRAFESYTNALRMFEQAHDGFIDGSPDDVDLTHVQKAYCLIGLGNLRLIAQEYKHADAHYREALSLFDKYLPAGHPDQSRTRQKIATIIHIYQSKPARALEDYDDCLENYLRALPSDHVDIARVYTDIAYAYEQLPNKLSKALEYAKKAVDIFEKSLPKEHTDNVTLRMIMKRIQRKLSLEI